MWGIEFRVLGLPSKSGNGATHNLRLGFRVRGVRVRGNEKGTGGGEGRGGREKNREKGKERKAKGERETKGG